MFIYDMSDNGYPVEDPDTASVTQHTIIMSGTVFTTRSEGKTAAEWLAEALNGHPAVLGRGLLG